MSRIPVVEASHERVARILRTGDLAVDATAGNGGDTEFLCWAVGPSGRVIAIDIQTEAVEATRDRLRSAGLLDRCILIEADHARLGELIDRHGGGRRPRAVMFNLGYLPGGKTDVITQPESTIQALDAATACLVVAGILSIVIYRGHDRATTEAAAVEKWLSGLEESKMSVEWLGRDGVPLHRPYAVFVGKLAPAG